MVVIKKFKALRPAEGLEKQVASFPYDVINSQEARQIANWNPHSFLHVVKPEIDLPENTDIYSDETYAKAKENLQKFIEEWTLVRENSEKVYVYAQTMNWKKQYWIVASSFVEDYNNGKIKKHEFTRPDKEADRIRHVDETNINAWPIFLTYKSKDTVNELVNTTIQNTPLYDFTADDGIGHTVWICEDSVADQIVEEFANIDATYVADWHHRTASAAAVANKRKQNNPNHDGTEEYNFFLSVLFPDEQLLIMDYNRIVKDLNGLSKEEFLEKLQTVMSVEKKWTSEYKPTKKWEFGMYLDWEWYWINIKDELVDLSDPVNSLDVALLQNNVLNPLLWIQDPRTSKRIRFVWWIRWLSELEKNVNSGEYQVAFAMYPTAIQELINIADAWEVMPPKSTRFEPKLRSGLLIHELQ